MSTMHTYEPHLEEKLREALAVASELADSRDVDVTLQTVVRRTRHLLHSDMAYVSLNDPITNTTYIRESDGVSTAAYRTIEMPVGTGILGQVASGLAPFQTPNYLLDESMPHLPAIDAIVEGEGVKTVMGVPLRIGTEVMGALMVAERKERVFSPAHLDIVESFGKVVAVALKRADEYTQAARRQKVLEEELNNATQQVSHLKHQLHFGSCLRNRLADEMNAECLVRETALAARKPVALFTTYDELIAAHDGQESGAFATSPSQEWVHALETTIEVPTTDLKLCMPPNLTNMEKNIIDVAADHLPLTSIMIETQHLRQNRLDTDLLDSLLSDRHPTTHQLVRQLQSRGSTTSQSLYLALLAVDEATGRKMEPALRRHPKTYVVAQRPEGLCIIFGDEAFIQDFPHLTEIHELSPSLKGAYSGPIQATDRLTQHMERARSGLLILQYTPREGLLNSNEVGLLGEVLQLSASPEHRRDILAPIKPLIDHDQHKAGELTTTALTYFENDRRIDRTAESLFVHRNTIKQRLKKITQLMGSDWFQAPRSLDLHWALRAWAWRPQHTADQELD